MFVAWFLACLSRHHFPRPVRRFVCSPIAKEDNLKQMNSIYDKNPTILEDFHSALYQNRLLANVCNA